MLISVILLFLIIVFTFYSKSKYFIYYTKYIFPVYKNTIGRICNIIPYSIFQWLVIVLVIVLVYLLIKKRKAVVPYLLSLFLIYTLTCGSMYNRQDLHVSSKEITQEQIDALATLIMEKINALDYQPLSLDEIIELSPQVMNNLEEGYYPKPKKIIGSKYMSYFGITGIYSPFTIEANIDIDTPLYSIPFCCCHELSHLNGYMKEEQANFNAYKACVESNIPYFEYSAYMQIISKLSNYASFKITVPEYLYNDLQEGIDYWNDHEGTLSDLEDQVNDTYLKANNDQGTVSYGQLIYDLIEYYCID